MKPCEHCNKRPVKSTRAKYCYFCEPMIVYERRSLKRKLEKELVVKKEPKPKYERGLYTMP